MKEAAGEANLTVVAIILIGVIAAVVTPIISQMMTTTKNRACCTEAGGRWEGAQCVGLQSAGTASYNTCTTSSNSNTN